MPRRKNKSSLYYLVYKGEKSFGESPNLYSKARIRGIYIVPGNKKYKKGMPTIPKVLSNAE